MKDRYKTYTIPNAAELLMDLKQKKDEGGCGGDEVKVSVNFNISTKNFSISFFSPDFSPERFVDTFAKEVVEGVSRREQIPLRNAGHYRSKSVQQPPP